MDDRRAEALLRYRSYLTCITANNLLPDLRSGALLTDAESTRIWSKSDNTSQVHELIVILLTKGSEDFDRFILVLKKHGYKSMAKRLRDTAGGTALHMSPWNKDALESLRDQLKGSVWMDLRLIGKLERAAGGFMDQSEVQTVKRLSGNREKVGLVIDALVEDEEFHAFCELLRGGHYDSLANSLESEAAKFKKTLEEEYRRAALPMSPWNSGALVSLQERLKNRVWLDTMLIGQLGRAVGGFMDQTEVQNVKLLSGNRERVGLVIDVLRAKGDRDFYAFCKLLQRNEYNDLVNLLEDKASQLKDELEKDDLPMVQNVEQEEPASVKQEELPGVDSRVAASGPVDMTKQAVVHIDTNDPKFGSGSGFIAEIQVTEILTKLVLMTCGHILPCPSVAQKSIIFFRQVGGNHAETVIKGEELFDCQFFKTDDEKLYVGGRKLDYTVVEVKQDVMEKYLKDYVPKPLVLRKGAEMMEREGSQMDGSLYIGLYMRELIPFANSGRLEGSAIICMPFVVPVAGSSGAPVLNRYNDEWTVVGLHCAEVGIGEGTTTFVTTITAIIDHIRRVKENISYGVVSRGAASGSVDMTKQAVVHIDTNDPKFGSGSGFIAEIQVTEILTKLVLVTCGHILPCPSVAQKSIIFFGQVGGNHAETVIKGEELFDCHFFKTDDEKLYVGGRKLDYTVVEVKQDVMEKYLKDYVPKPLVLRKCAEMMECEGSQMDGSLYIGLYMRELIPFANSGRLEGSAIICMPFVVPGAGSSGAPVLNRYNDEWTVVGLHCAEVGIGEGTTTFVTTITAIIDHIRRLDDNISYGGDEVDNRPDVSVLPRYAEIVEEAIRRKGKVDIEVSKIVFLGPPEAGKTQLKRALMRKYERTTQSTPLSAGAEQVVERYVEKDGSTSPWKMFTKEMLQEALLKSAEDVNDEGDKDTSLPPGLRLQNPQCNDPELISDFAFTEPPREDMPQQSATETAACPSAEHSHSLIPAAEKGQTNDNLSILSDEFSRLTDAVQSLSHDSAKEGLSMRYIHLIDNGGQPAFFAAHPVVATSRATYVLVYNMQEGLNAKPNYTYRKKGCSGDGKVQSTAIPNEHYTNLDLLKASLLTIGNLKEKFMHFEKEVKAFGSDGLQKSSMVRPPYLVVVGTRYSEPPMEGAGRAEEQNKQLGLECSVFPAWCDAQKCEVLGKDGHLCPVDSLREDCPGVQAVRDMISAEGFSLKLPIPISWFQCHLLFWYAREERVDRGEHKPSQLEVLPFSVLTDLCMEKGLISGKDELLAMVRAFHVLGLFFFPALNEEKPGWKPEGHEPVFTNPDLLYGELTKVLEITFEEGFPGKPDADDVRLLSQLKEDGELTLRIMERLGIPDTLGPIAEFRRYLLHQLSTWGLAAELPTWDETPANDPIYFVPCILQPFREQGNDPGTNPNHDADPEALCVSLTICNKEAYYIPNGAFTHFIVNLLKSHRYVRQAKMHGVQYCFSDSVILVRNASPPQIKYKYELKITNDKLECVTICISPTFREGKCPHDCHQIIWDELKVAMEETCTRMYSKETRFQTVVATKCHCHRFAAFPHLAEVCVGEGYLSCLRGPQQCDLDNLLFLEKVMKARQKTVQTSDEANHGAPIDPKRAPCAPFSAATFLKTFEEDFFDVTNAKLSLLRLKRKGVISLGVKAAIENENDEDAKEVLYDHLMNNATWDTLKEYCSVAIAAEGFPRMQELGRKMLQALIHGAVPFEASVFLKTYEDEFIEVVHARESLYKLKRLGVIPAGVKTEIEEAKDTNAREILYDHLATNATAATLREWCVVASEADGYPKMKQLGEKMLKALPPAQGGK